VSWQFYLSSATSEDLSAIRISATGVPDPAWPQVIGGPPITRAIDNQYQMDSAPDGSGGAFIVWDDRRDVLVSGFDIYAQHVQPDGQLAPGWPIDGLPILAVPGTQEFSQLLPDGEGGVYVACLSSDTTVLVQRLRGDGTRPAGWPAGGLKLIDLQGIGTSIVGNIGIVSDGAGGCLVAFVDFRRGLGAEIYVQRILPDGTLAAGWAANGNRVVDASSEQQYRIEGRMVSDGSGGCYVAWSATSAPAELDDNIFATHVLADGSVAAGWPATGLPVAVQPGWQLLSGSGHDGSGGLLLAWQDSRINPARAYVQRLLPDGSLAPGWQPQGNPISDLAGYHYAPRLAADGIGGAFVTFQEGFNNHGFVQRVLGDGTRPVGWPSTGLALVDQGLGGTAQEALAISADGSGGAIVAWQDSRQGTATQIFAQRYSGDDITATTMSLVHVEALPERVSLLWSRGGANPAEATVERVQDGTWQSLARQAFDGSGRLEYEDRSVVPGTTYRYRLRWSEGGTDQVSTEAIVNVPLAIALGLEGFRPNPAVGEALVAFSLPRAGRTTLDIVDLAGRRVRSHDASGLDAGRHVVAMSRGQRLQPGVYWVRLTHDDRVLSVKGMVLR
jgi:hypothetical protein